MKVADIEMPSVLPLLLIAIAPFIGSFLGVLAVRLPERRPILLGRSACDICGHPLRWIDLIPFVSFSVLRGRCRDCASPISTVHIAAELGSLTIAIWAATITTGEVLIGSVAFGWMLLALALADFRSGLLPDTLTFPLALMGMVATYLIIPETITDHLIGGAAGFVLFAVFAWLYRQLRKHDGLGSGDAKLLAAIGCWLGWQGLPTVILFATIIGLVLALILKGRELSAKTRIAFGPALALAGWLVWLYGPLTS